VRIDAVETIRPHIQPNLLFVQLHTDDGRIGLGEAFFGAGTVEAYIHDAVADILFAAANPTPEHIGAALTPYIGFQGAGAEMRGNAAVDLALWDLLGQQAELPLVALFGGPTRTSIPIYNTCAGPGYVSTSTRQQSDNWGIASNGPWEDLSAFLDHPARLARELWDTGYRGMKIWPFDRAAEETGGTHISPSQLAAGIAIVEAIRAEVGDEMNLMIELHGLWNRRGATAIMKALQPYHPYWVEDPIRPDAVDALAALAAAVDVPIATGETAVGRRGFLPLLQRGAVDVVTVDVQWTGGLTEARKVAALADTYGVPVAPHDCTGPATFAACVHLVLSAPNGLIQETVRAFLNTWYAELVTGLPECKGGEVFAPTAPGHGVSLRPDLTAIDRRVSRR
jgi:L-alanine-DL-glutamate epimerase-like enolase superfamily enzyme